MCTQFSGFVKLKKIQKSEKNSKVGGWVKPKLEFLFSGGIFFFFFFVLFLCFQMFPKKYKKLSTGRWGLINPNFSQIFGFF